jgi:tetratricopeptide (TPR) repeat protein
MKNSIFKGLNSLVLMGFALSLIGLGVAKAQVGSLKITDSSGREVVVYKESHALVIWAGDYQHWDKLNNIEDEAKDVVAALERQGFEVTIVPNPTGQTLKQAIQTFIANYGYLPDNRLVIFFSGHGYTRKKTKGYLVPIDAPDPASNPQSQQAFLKVALDMEQVESWARQIEAKHVLFVFDSCFSGTIFKQRSSSEKPLYIQSVMNKPVRQFLTAGDANQRVPAKSVFTPLFIRALEGEADVINRDGYVTGNELGNYLKQNLSEYTKQQTPQFGTIRDPDLDQGDIVFRDLNASPLVATNSSRLTVNPSPVETNSNRSQPSPTPVTTPQSQPSPSPQLTAKAFYSSGVEKYNAGDNQGAIAKFTQSIQIDTENSDAYVYRGLSKKNLGDNQGAIADFNQAINLNPNYAEAYNNRGNSKKHLGDNQGAIADYNQAIKLKSDYAEAYYNRGFAKDDLKDYQGAIADYNESIRLKNPELHIPYNGRGISKMNLKDYQGAIADYNQAIQINKNWGTRSLADAYNNRGAIKNDNLKDYQGAIADYNQAIKLNPDHANAYYSRGFLYQKLGDNQNAINDYRQAAKLYQQQNNQTWYQNSLDRLKELGVSN